MSTVKTVERSLDNLNFTNTALRSLPVEEDRGSSYRLVENACFCRIQPTPVENARLIAVSKPALKLVDMETNSIATQQFVNYFSGNQKLPGSEPASHCYCGYQYGLFSGQLGDGAAMYLGGVENHKGEHWELQLKGVGRTPFGRAGADGRKVLRSSIREFLCSEAMHHLGIATTRAGSLIASDTKVYRDPLWTGAEEVETAAIVLRVAPTFFRIGSLEICNGVNDITGLKGPSGGNNQLLQQMVDYVIKQFYPKIDASTSCKENKYVDFFDEMTKVTGQLVAQWQAVGFCHGVLNTDNISLVGLTMDYGPFSFIEQYDPDHISNGSDYWGRYSYRRQKENCRWCCERLVETLLPLVDGDTTRFKLDQYEAAYEEEYSKIMRQKLGLQTEHSGDRELIAELLHTMQYTGADFTCTFRGLSLLSIPGSSDFEASANRLRSHLLASCCSLQTLKKIYFTRDYPTAKELELSLWVLQMNPQVKPRYLQMAKEAVDRLNNRDIIKHVQNITDEQKKAQDEKLWNDWIAKYSERLQKEYALCADVDRESDNRTIRMNKVNPRFVLKRSILQDAISDAVDGDYRTVNILLKMVQDPYAGNPGFEDASNEDEKQEMERILGKFDGGINTEMCRLTCSS